MDYNAHGELASKLNTQTGQASTYQYTSLGQLRSVTMGGNTISYILDGENKRVGRQLNGATTNLWVYDGKGRLVAELNPDSSLKSRFIYGSQSHSPDYMIQGSTQYFFYKDHLGSIFTVVNASTGATVQSMRYNDRGLVTSDTNPGFQPFGYAGGHYDYQTGLVRFGARDYDGLTGRWTAKDPILFGGGQENLYVYVNNDPVNFVDPSGQIPVGIATGAVGAVVGGISGFVNSQSCTNAGKVLDMTIGAVSGFASGLFAGAGARAVGIVRSFFAAAGGLGAGAGVTAIDLTIGSGDELLGLDCKKKCE